MAQTTVFFDYFSLNKGNCGKRRHGRWLGYKNEVTHRPSCCKSPGDMKKTSHFCRSTDAPYYTKVIWKKGCVMIMGTIVPFFLTPDLSSLFSSFQFKWLDCLVLNKMHFYFDWHDTSNAMIELFSGLLKPLSTMMHQKKYATLFPIFPNIHDSFPKMWSHFLYMES